MRPLTLLSLALLCAGCPTASKEGPPPPETYAIASAAPGALGALAAGTKAAPRAVTPSMPAGPSAGEAAPLDPEGDELDAGQTPEADAGTSPEDLPL
jgi:hypothetical protein